MKKVVCIVLSVVFCLGMAAGCTPGATGSVAPGVTASAAESTAPEEKTNFNATGLPIVNEPITIKVLVGLNTLTDDLGTIKTFIDMEAKTNIKIDWEYVRTDWDARKTLMLASGDLPDAIFGGGLTATDILTNVEYFAPMEEYIEKYCPNIRKMHDEEPDTLKRATAPDGHVYTLSSVMPWRPRTIDLAFINQTWLDKLGLKMPETTDEFYETMKAFKTQDPNGNGQADEIPVETVGIYQLAFILTAFDVVDNIWGWLQVDNGTVKYCRAMPEYKAAIQYMHKLYSEGLIDQEAFTQKGAQYRAKLQSQGDIIVGTSMNWTIETAVGTENKSHYVQLMPLKGPDGEQHWRDWLESRIWTGSFQMTTANKYPAETMRWIDQWYDEEVSAQLYFGPIDVGLKKLSDGKYEIIGPPDPTTPYDSWLWKNGMGSAGPMYVGRTFEQLIIPNGWVTDRIETDTPLIPYLKESYPVIFFRDKDETERLAVLETDITKLAESKMAKWIVEGGVEEEWDAYIADLNKMGLEEMVGIYQKDYNDYYNK